LKKPITKIGLVEWFKVKALSSNPSTAKKRKEKISTPRFFIHGAKECPFLLSLVFLKALTLVLFLLFHYSV
jgi:hypothetical protein